MPLHEWLSYKTVACSVSSFSFLGGGILVVVFCCVSFLHQQASVSFEVEPVAGRTVIMRETSNAYSLYCRVSGYWRGRAAKQGMDLQLDWKWTGGGWWQAAGGTLFAEGIIAVRVSACVCVCVSACACKGCRVSDWG